MIFTNVNMGSDSYEIFMKTAARSLKTRGIAFGDGDGISVTLRVDAMLHEGQYIIDSDGKNVKLIAAEDYTVFAAFGRFLTESHFDGRGAFTPFEGKIDFIQKNPIRGMYFATHFFNFYHIAPMEKVGEIIEDLALIGCNTLLVWFDMHQYKGMDDDGAQFLVGRLHDIMRYANRIGIPASLTMLANEGFANSPEELRAEWWIQGDYKVLPRGHYHVEICPNKEGGIEEIMRERRQVFEAFRDVDVKYICYWPYDQGGCTCAKCQPWGANGFLRILPHFKKAVSEYFPKAEIIVSTWYFDKFIPGEWDAFYPHISDGSLCGSKYIMSFFHSGNLPAPIAENGIPEGVSFIDFPEISMHLCAPWGGFGANPLPEFMNVSNSKAGEFYQGGYPYSEGIWEDLNKHICLYRYSGRGTDAYEAVRDYVKFRFGLEGEANEELSDAIIKLEYAGKRAINKNTVPVEAPDPDLPMQRGTTPVQYKIADPTYIQYCYDVLSKYNEILPENVTKDFRFRIIYLRAVIDRELMLHDYYPIRSRICQESLKELFAIYCCDSRSYEVVAPPFGW